MIEKELKVTVYRQTPIETNSPIEKVVHGLPTWMFKSLIGTHDNFKCPICRQEMDLTIAHGQYITTCSFVKTKSGFMSPIHTACYNAIGLDANNVNHFEHSASILDEMKLTV